MRTKPKMACGNCKYITNIMESRTGKYYCKDRDKYVDIDKEYCIHYKWKGEPDGD